MSFEVAAQSYDRFMGDWSRLLSPLLADLAHVEPGHRVLDVGCGPGALTAELVARVGAGCVSAVDPSAPFVAAARDRHPGVDVHLAGAEALPFSDDEFDAALAQLVVHFLTDPVAGIREMARVTRPGGAIAACVWDYEGHRDPLGPFWEAAQEMDPGIEGEGGWAGAREGHLVELFEAAGLRQVEGSTLSIGRVFADFGAWWEPFTLGVGPAGRLVQGLDVGRRTELRERCRARLPSGSFRLDASAWAAVGVAGD